MEKLTQKIWKLSLFLDGPPTANTKCQILNKEKARQMCIQTQESVMNSLVFNFADQEACRAKHRTKNKISMALARH